MQYYCTALDCTGPTCTILQGWPALHFDELHCTALHCTDLLFTMYYCSALWNASELFLQRTPGGGLTPLVDPISPQVGQVEDRTLLEDRDTRGHGPTDVHNHVCPPKNYAQQSTPSHVAVQSLNIFANWKMAQLRCALMRNILYWTSITFIALPSSGQWEEGPTKITWYTRYTVQGML